METDLSTRLTRAEEVIETGIATFISVGESLAEIRDQKLWMSGGAYKDFDTYCKKRWNWGPRYVRQVCQSADAAKRISEAPSEGSGTIVPREGQVRPLLKLPESEQGEAWKEAAAEAEEEGKPLTAKKVQEVVARRLPEPPTPSVNDAEPTPGPPEPEPAKPKNGSEIIGPKRRKDLARSHGDLHRFICDEAKIGEKVIPGTDCTFKAASVAIYEEIKP